MARTSYSSSPAPAPIPRRGRPQGSKNGSALAVVLDPATSTPVNFAPGRLPDYASSLSASPAPTFPVKKKLGRPFKTAEAAAKAAAKAARRAGAETGVTKKRGRPFKIRHQLNIPVPEPNFYSFDCEWKDCEAELQNLETLQLHIKIVHRKRNSDGLLECRWGKCCGEKQVLGLMEPHGKEFKSKEKWAEHVYEHTNRFAWHLGDGPKGTDLCMSLLPFSLTNTQANQIQRRQQQRHKSTRYQIGSKTLLPANSSHPRSKTKPLKAVARRRTAGNAL